MALADAAKWILHKAGVSFVIHYLNDFLIIGAPNSCECQSAMKIVVETFAKLGFLLAINKLEGPTTCLDFLGFEIDSRMMAVRLPQEKLMELQHLIRQEVLHIKRAKITHGQARTCRSSGTIETLDSDVAGNRWLQLDKESITLKELLPIILARAVWGKSLNNASVTVHCDNLGTAALVNSGYSKVPQIMHLLRCLFFIRAQFQIQLWAVHIPGIENTLVDATSRNNFCLLYSQVPEAIGQQSPILPQLISLLLDPHLDWTSVNWTRQSTVFSRLSSYHQKELSVRDKMVSHILPSYLEYHLPSPYRKPLFHAS